MKIRVYQGLPDILSIYLAAGIIGVAGTNFNLHEATVLFWVIAAIGLQVSADPKAQSEKII